MLREDKSTFCLITLEAKVILSPNCSAIVPAAGNKKELSLQATGKSELY